MVVGPGLGEAVEHHIGVAKAAVARGHGGLHATAAVHRQGLVQPGDRLGGLALLHAHEPQVVHGGGQALLIARLRELLVRGLETRARGGCFAKAGVDGALVVQAATDGGGVSGQLGRPAAQLVDLQQVPRILAPRLLEHVQARRKAPHMLVMTQVRRAVGARHQVRAFGDQPVQCLVAVREVHDVDRSDRRQFGYVLVVGAQAHPGAAGGPQVPVEQSVCATSALLGLLLVADGVFRVGVQEVVDAVPAGAFLRHQVRAYQRVQQRFRGDRLPGQGLHRVHAEAVPAGVSGCPVPRPVQGWGRLDAWPRARRLCVARAAIPGRAAPTVQTPSDRPWRGGQCVGTAGLWLRRVAAAGWTATARRRRGG